MNRRAWIDFTITLVLLGTAFFLAFFSTILAQTDWTVGAASAICSLVLALGAGLYIVPRLAKRVRWELLGFGIRTKVTNEGFMFLAVVVVIGIAAWNTENNLLYLILASLLAFVIASGNIARLMLHDVKVQLRFPDHLFAGDPANIAVSLTNAKYLIPSCSVLVQANIVRDGEIPVEDPQATRRQKRRAKKKKDANEGAPLAHFIVAPPRSTTRQVVQHTFAKRGRYQIERFTIATKFPSGFFRKWRQVASEGVIVVFPRANRIIGSIYHSLPILVGSAESHIKGDGVDLFGLRDYRPTDHLRNIDWKSTARTSRVTVRETVREDEFRCAIYFDPTLPPGVDPAVFSEQFERAIEEAASLAKHFITEGADVELVTPGARIESGGGSNHLLNILGALAVLSPIVDSGDRSENELALSTLLPGIGDEHRFKILFTASSRGTIPASVWRSARVVFFDEIAAD